MNDYKISVIIPVYNGEKYIERAMQSLLDQKIGFENLQIIFVDDCSTDKSWDIVCEFKNKYENVFVYRLSENSGSAGVPRNKGLEFVKAKYVMFLDQGDIYYKEACEVLYNEMINNDVDLVSGSYRETKLSDGINVDLDGAEHCVELSKGIYDLLKDEEKVVCAFINHWTKIYKIDLIKKKGILFGKVIPGAEQVFLYHYLLECKKAKCIEELIYCHIRVQNSCLYTINESLIKGMNENCKEFKDLFFKYGKEKLFQKFITSKMKFNFVHLLSYDTLKESDMKLIFYQYKWICDYIAEKSISIKSEFAQIMLEAILHKDLDLFLCLCKNLQIIKKYNLELNEWFLRQITYTDARIVELKNYVQELEKSKEWFLEQIGYKDTRITELENWNKELGNAKSWLEDQVKFKDIRINELEDALNKK